MEQVLEWPKRKHDIESLFQIRVTQNGEGLDERYGEVLDGDWVSTSTVLNRLQQRESEFLRPSEVRHVFKRLRFFFSTFYFYALALGPPSSEVNSLAKFMARDSEGDALILIPDNLESSEKISILDPFPPIAQLGNENEFPGFLFWSKKGNSRYAPQNGGRAEDVYKRIIGMIRRTRFIGSPRRLEKDFEEIAITQSVNRTLGEYETKSGAKKILHLSDLHFRTSGVKNKLILKTQIDNIKNDIGQIVITGDLINHPRKRPSKKAVYDFIDFTDDLERFTGNRVFFIPGNHDRRRLGTFGTTYAEYVNMQWRYIEPSDELECVFVCFDSSRTRWFARGEVTQDQCDEVHLAFERECRLRPEIRDYSRVALVHHHLFPLNLEESNFFQKLNYRTIKSTFLKPFVRMVGAKRFLAWCAGKEIPMVLHGHEHLQWIDSEEVLRGDGTKFVVKTVACGTSLGVGGSALTYNTLAWDSVNRIWKETPYEWDGKTFNQLNVIVNLR